MARPGPAATPVPTRAAAPETPFFFESNGRPLYAVFHEAAPGRADAPVVVHVHGLGVEQLTLYRQEALTARAAAAAGLPVLRYHARGHGDSAGSFASATLDSLVEDARAAAAEARRRAGRARIVWLGVRFGGLVAARAAAGRDDTAGLALWEPVDRPADYFRAQLRSLLFSQVAGGMKPDATADQLLERLDREGSVDVHGYLLHRDLLRSAREASLGAALARFSSPALLVQVQPVARLSSPLARLAEALRAAGAKVTTACVPGEMGSQLMSNPAWESPELTRTTVEWLDALARD